MSLQFFFFNFISFYHHLSSSLYHNPQSKREMFVIKRDGSEEEVEFDKITARIKNLAEPLSRVDPVLVAQKVCAGVFPGVTTTQLDNLAAEISASLATTDPQYGKLAGRLLMSNLHKQTKANFSDVIRSMWAFTHNQTGEQTSTIDYNVFLFVQDNKKVLDAAIKTERDFEYTYFAIKTLERSYLQRVNDVVVERPQHMLMRVACGIWTGDIPKVMRTYDMMSRGYFTHASPTLFNAGTTHPSLSSCFLNTIKEDSVDGIYDTIKECAKISKFSGGIGLSVSTVRAKGSYVRGTNGFSDGIAPMCRVFNNTARYVKQGNRKGSFAVYLEPWHADIFEFLELKKPHGNDELRARDLFYGLWIPDLFMQRVKEDGDWSLMCPDKSPGLCDVYGDDFVELYEAYEHNKNYLRKVKARDVWNAIIESQQDSGTPYMCYKDAVNRKSNQKNLGTIRSSNLCVTGDTQIMTMSGYHKIKQLCDVPDVPVWNGHEFSAVTVRKTQTNVTKILEVSLSNGTSIRCTFNHHFYLKDGMQRVEAVDLKPNDVLVDLQLPHLNQFAVRNPRFNYPYTHGIFVVLGQYVNLHPVIKEPLWPGASIIFDRKVGDTMLLYADIPHLSFVPLVHNRWQQTQWLQGVIDASAFIYGRDLTTQGITIFHPSEYIMKNLLLLLQLFGAKSTIHISPEICALHVNAVESLIDAGLDLRDYQVGRYVEEPELTVLNVKRLANMVEDTYCFTEPKRNMGVFNGNLAGQCVEIVEYSAPDQVAVCNLASVALPKFINPDGTFDHVELFEVVRVILDNLNRVIDVNMYPVNEARKSNSLHRPVAVGVQGLADVFMKMKFPYESDAARKLNVEIFETIYFACLTESNLLAQEQGPYDSFAGSPASKGILQFDLWGVTPSGRWDWDHLKSNIKESGLRNSLVTAAMPTASTAQIMGNTESFEPLSNNLYVRRTQAGEFVVVNNMLVNDLQDLGLWSLEMKQRIVAHKGSVQNIPEIPREVKALYKTVWEMKMKTLVDMSAERGAFIDQSQSFNCYLKDPTMERLTSMHFYTWGKGLKTGMYYLRTRPAVDAIQFTVEPEEEEELICSLKDKEEGNCLSCQ